MSPAPAAGPPRPRRILVIRLGALGDIALALGAFAAIRKAHADAHITLLTTAPYAGFLRPSGWFDDVWVDRRRRFWRLGALLALRARLRSGRFDRVYDFQTTQRTTWYFRLLGPGPRPEWSGIAPGCSHPHDNPARNAMHTLERQAEQLAIAGIFDVPPPDLSWVEADVDRFGLADGFALLIPGASAVKPEKRWPVERFAAIAQRLAEKGIQPVVLGTALEAGAAAAIQAACPSARSLVGHTTIPDLAVLGRRAACALGGDTGPLHVVAVAGAPTVALFSRVSDPRTAAPRGRHVTVIRRESLEDVPAGEVAAALNLV